MKNACIPLFLTIPEACECARISRTTAYREIAAGRLRVSRIGRAVRVHRDDIEAWANERRERKQESATNEG